MLPFFYNADTDALATRNFTMRLPIALACCVLSTPALAHDANARDGAPPTSAPQAPQAGSETTIIYKSASDEALRCDRVIDDKSLRELVREEARAIGVDDKLALVILNLESRSGADLNSPKGARGPMQLMPATAAQYGVRDICDPAQNVHGALLFLKDLAAQFSGNVMLIAAAYNAGSKRVYQANGVPAITETVRYVASAANQYYDLGSLTARRASSPSRPIDQSGGDDVASISAEKPESRKGQEWIGGSVLYVSSEEQGDK
jgi:soluble lytic murein transglycosylase-like protein